MLNIFAFVTYVLATVVQWNNNWWLVGVCGIFAVLNLLIAIQWVVKQFKNRKVKW